jgi:hypothetical protein
MTRLRQGYSERVREQAARQANDTAATEDEGVLESPRHGRQEK